MSNPAWLVDDLFARLAVRYGEAFARQYDGLALAAVKADWLRVLGSLPRHAVAHGLEQLPADRPPNAMQFRGLCMGGLRDERQPALPAPAGVPCPVHVRQRLAALKARIGHRPELDAALQVAEEGGAA